MKKLTFIFLLLLSQASNAQIEISWPVCIEESKYQYTNPKMDDFKVINKKFKFCYNEKYFAIVDKTGDMQIFPLERRSYDKNSDGDLVEEFTNGDCKNYKFGDIVVRMTYTKPQTIFINFSPEIIAHAYYIETNSLPLQKVKKQP